ncbi:MAG TPA: hypothetical protein VN802_08075 [Stellaceae bacterium]|nr:hypothetical protein [Stellaceae bacterium]
MLDKLFPVLFLVGLISPLAAIVSAIVLFVRHRARVEPERHVPVIAFILAVIVCGGVAGYFGIWFGIAEACSGPKAGNLCGLWGFFVTGPISFALAVVLVGLAVSSVQPAATHGGGNPD